VNAQSFKAKPCALSIFKWVLAILGSTSMSTVTWCPAIFAAPAIQLSSRWNTGTSGEVFDNNLGMVWTREDNGAPIDWVHANDYCHKKGIGWRLPSIDELTTLFESESTPVPCGRLMCRVGGAFKLSSNWFWSSTRTKDIDGDDLVLGMQLTNGARTESVLDFSDDARALCVKPGSSSRTD
jgi:hypothetical protein